MNNSKIAVSTEEVPSIKGFSTQESHGSDDQVGFRKRLEEAFIETPIPTAELMTSMAIYMRSSALVKILVLDDLYRRIQKVPGCIMEFGTRWGQNLIVFENLRAIYEPFNKTRKIVGFDTFEGYQGGSDIDKESAIFSEGTYQTTANYPAYLRQLLSIHEGNNVLGHVSSGHEVIAGNVSNTVTNFLKLQPETIVALAYFDIGLYTPTKDALLAIKPHLVPGSVILLDQLTWAESPGEAIAFKETFQRHEYTIEKSTLTPMRAIITIR